MTDIPIKAKVQCSDGPCGKSTHVIAEPESGKLTHFVVKDKKLPDLPDRLVPVEKIADTTGGVIFLNCTLDEVERMRPFTTIRYVQKSRPDYGDAFRTGMPSDTWVDKTTEEHIPAGELALSRGMAVNTREEGKVGQVDQLVVDEDSGVITHLLMLEGHLWGKKDVAIPVSAIDVVDEDTVYLKIDKKAVQALPIVPIKH